MAGRIGIFDTETNGLLPSVTKIHCSVVKDIDSNEIRKFTPETIDLLPEYLNNFVSLIGHNCIAYDFPVLRKIFGYEYLGRKIDTLLISRLQRPNRKAPPNAPPGTFPHSVEGWGYRLGRGKVSFDAWEEYSPGMLHRCTEDVEIQHLIYKALLKEGEGEGWENAHRLNAKLFDLLQRQEEYGWLVDRHHLNRCFHILNHWIGRIDRAVAPKLPIIVEPLETKKDGEYRYVKKPFLKTGLPSSSVVSVFGEHGSQYIGGPFSRISFRPIDLDKSSEVKDFLLGLGWEPKEWNTDNVGKRSSPKLSKDDPFQGIEGGLGKLLVKRVQCKQRLGIIKGWEGLIRPDGRISPTISGVTTTSRLRHSGIVNVPKKDEDGKGAFFGRWMREIFIPHPGWVMVGCDSKGNQLRQLAARIGDPEFTKAALLDKKRDGIDFHEINRQFIDLSRTEAKNFFYGLIFGAGDNKLGKVMKKDAAAGKERKEYYFNRIPGLRVLIENLQAEWRKTAKLEYDPDLKRKVLKNGFITGLDGRPIQVESEHAVLNYLLQSDEAIQMAAAYCWFHHQVAKRGYIHGKDWGMLIWYHDEFQFECRPEIATELALLAEQSITWAGKFYKIPILHEGESKIGKNWKETH